ncbi:hypothetical protein [Nocardioides soli]|uniref:Uncharacterized protein n=1 Tax=Nocardioides soli TaxID=1036020 RepID=A0A7W4YZI8_9ACTN|nr:hypothetical protein [Nocardioides soli]MBB3041224.1 hypothetical protein [Nocardioides soli]
MNDHTDQALGDTTPDQPTPSSTMTPFGDPAGAPIQPERPAPDATVRQWTLEQILDTAKRPRRRAKICLRADLQAEYDQCIYELSGLIDAQGRVIVDDERPVGEQSARARASELADRMVALRREMAAFMWYPLFEGLDSDALQAFNSKHRPKPKSNGEGPDMTEYNTLLIAECSVEPRLSVDDVRALRKKLGAAAMGELSATANEVCAKGGVDFPQLPSGLARLQER